MDRSLGAIGIYVVNETAARDILILRSAGGSWEVEDFLVTNANGQSPAISPDGRWLAYVSDESSQDEIYVTSRGTGEGKWLVSSNGGREPAWSRNGRELFYRRGRGIYSVPIAEGSDFNAGTPVELFEVEASTTEGPTGERDRDATPDGRRFLFPRTPRVTSPFSLRVIMNFPAALERASR